MIVAGTGHRPNKVLIGQRNAYHPDVHLRLVDLARATLRRKQPTRVISGLAQGWDTALALAAVELGIPFHAYVPFQGQESKWPDAARRRYHDLLRLAERVLIVCPGGYSMEKLQRRNECMVDDSDLLAALWNGTPGGTRNCLDYADRVGRQAENVWRRWVRHAGGTQPQRSVLAENPVYTALLESAGGLA